MDFFLLSRTRTYRDFLKFRVFRCFSVVDADTIEDAQIQEQRFGRNTHPEQTVDQRMLRSVLWAQGRRARTARVSQGWWGWMKNYKSSGPALGVCQREGLSAGYDGYA